MPVDYSKYHPKWSLISRLVRLRRAQNRCERCGRRNYAVGYWKEGTWFYPDEVDPPEEGFADAKTARAWASAYNEKIGWEYSFETQKVWMIVITVAHLDHDVNNNRFDNLAALCQRCHLTHDRADNADRRRYGRTGRHYNQIRLEL